MVGWQWDWYPYPKPPPWWWLLFCCDEEEKADVKVSGWKSALIDISVDNDLTAEVDLLELYSFVQVLIPTIDAALVSLQIGTESGGTFQDLHDWKDADADNTVLYATTSGEGGIIVTFFVGAVQFLKVKTSEVQTADRQFYVRGIG